LERAVGPFARHAHDGLRVGLVLHAIADREANSLRRARSDDALALADGHAHGLFAEHVLAGLRRHDRILGVQSSGRDDVHDVDVWIVGDARKRGVIVEVAIVDRVAALPARDLGGVPVTMPRKLQ
jgi:hypothetical protein